MTEISNEVLAFTMRDLLLAQSKTSGARMQFLVQIVNKLILKTEHHDIIIN